MAGEKEQCPDHLGGTKSRPHPDIAGGQGIDKERAKTLQHLPALNGHSVPASMLQRHAVHVTVCLKSWECNHQHLSSNTTSTCCKCPRTPVLCMCTVSAMEQPQYTSQAFNSLHPQCRNPVFLAFFPLLVC